jgi:hypothetical protein
VSAYCSSAEPLLEGLDPTPTNRFPTLELYETDDPTAYFDARQDEETGYRWASPIQTYLEMAKSGDERLQNTAPQVRAYITNSL